MPLDACFVIGVAGAVTCECAGACAATENMVFVGAVAVHNVSGAGVWGK